VTPAEVIAACTGSPWLYAALFAAAVVDAVLPVVPSEALVATAGAAGLAGGPLAAVVAASALGATIGEHVAYAHGRRAGAALPPGRLRTAVARAGGALQRRGPLVLLTARFVPTGRTAAAMAAGAAGYPPLRFALLSGIGALLSATWAAAAGRVGALLAGGDPLAVLVLGPSIGLAVLGVCRLGARAPHRIGVKSSSNTSGAAAGLTGGSTM
jgi:membrane-associated protein